MNLELLTLCEFAANYGGKICIIGINDIFKSDRVPVQIAKCYIVWRIRYSPSEAGEHVRKISIIDADGKEMAPPLIDKVNVVLEDGSSGCVDTGLMNISGMPIKSFGEHSVYLNVDGQPLGSQPLYLVRAQRPT